MLGLKGFHIFFIVASILLALGVGAWGVQRYLEEGSRMGLGMGVLFFVVGFVLMVYGVRYFGKLRRLG